MFCLYITFPVPTDIKTSKIQTYQAKTIQTIQQMQYNGMDYRGIHIQPSYLKYHLLLTTLHTHTLVYVCCLFLQFFNCTTDKVRRILGIFFESGLSVHSLFKVAESYCCIFGWFHCFFFLMTGFIYSSDSIYFRLKSAQQLYNITTIATCT